jgi:hypothetical protein
VVIIAGTAGTGSLIVIGGYAATAAQVAGTAYLGMTVASGGQLVSESIMIVTDERHRGKRVMNALF